MSTNRLRSGPRSAVQIVDRSDSRFLTRPSLPSPSTQEQVAAEDLARPPALPTTRSPSDSAMSMRIIFATQQYGDAGVFGMVSDGSLTKRVSSWISRGRYVVRRALTVKRG
jgi:hypothetical protein